MKTKDIQSELVGKKVKFIHNGEYVEGVITGILEWRDPMTGKRSKGVKVELDVPVLFGGVEFSYFEFWADPYEYGNLRHLELLVNN